MPLDIIVANVNVNPKFNLQELSRYGSFGALATALNVHRLQRMKTL